MSEAQQVRHPQQRREPVRDLLGDDGAGPLQRVEVPTLYRPRRRTTGDEFVDKRSADEPAGKIGGGRLDLELLIEGRVSELYLNSLGAQ
jgi:hypothetical protein